MDACIDTIFAVLRAKKVPLFRGFGKHADGGIEMDSLRWKFAGKLILVE